MAATLLYWMYMYSPRIKDEKRAAALFLSFQEDVNILAILPSLITGWFERAMEDVVDRRDLLATLRKAVCSRGISLAHRKVVQAFLLHLASQPTIQNDLKGA